MHKRTLQTICVFGMSVILLLTVVALASQSETAAAQTTQPESQRRLISVAGTGRVTTPPDQATITIGVQITAPTLAAATQQAGDSMTKVLDAIKAQGVDAKDIQTSSYNVNPITNYKEGQPPETTGYQVTNVVTVTVRNLDNAGKILDAGMGAGANYLGGINFGIADPAPFQAQARTAAVKDAMRTAQTLADAAGVKLGSIVAIVESGGIPPQPLALPRAALAADAVGAGPVESGALEISATVQMQFEIAE